MWAYDQQPANFVGETTSGDASISLPWQRIADIWLSATVFANQGAAQGTGSYHQSGFIVANRVRFGVTVISRRQVLGQGRPHKKVLLVDSAQRQWGSELV